MMAAHNGDVEAEQMAQWIGFHGKIYWFKPHIFHGKIDGFPVKCSLKPIQ
jgi:hypothetical protein